MDVFALASEREAFGLVIAEGLLGHRLKDRSALVVGAVFFGLLQYVFATALTYTTSGRAAIVLTALSAYGLLWLVGRAWQRQRDHV